ncbi:hypothetical protein [Sphingomonas sp. Root710]|uniref:hypothetical protein n=1 Tax=Sphingomonas sp. Root710 TaxID=1736594 RepID=UPI0012E345FE|nr:hypothetical protein [Sphingomonas sp. Root710]
MESHVNPVYRLVVLIFGNPLTALWISLALLLWCALIIARNYIRYHRPLSRTLWQRVRAFGPVLDAAGTDDSQRVFSDQFYDLDAAITLPGILHR